MKNSIFVSLLLLYTVACSSISDVEDSKGEELQTKDKWVSEVLEYMPAPGQFINAGMGNMAAAQKLVGGTSVVSLGSYGGYIIFRFNHDVANGVGDDFVIHGNAYRNAVYQECSSSEPGIVQVSYDENGNGKPDDKWYELKGANHDEQGVIKNYEITYKRPANLEETNNVEWTDNQGKTGVVSLDEMESTRKNAIYPLAEFFKDGVVSETITFKGTLMPNNANRAPDNDKLWNQYAFGLGYVDNYSDDYKSTVGEDADTKNSNKFDIANAIDEDGNSVNLPKITFIRVYTAVLQTCGWLGETSTEVCGAISLRVPKK